jgi:hypothetical protein
LKDPTIIIEKNFSKVKFLKFEKILKKLIFLTIGLGIVLGIIIGANLVNRCASAQGSFPMCVTVYKYLVWPGTFPKTTQVIPVTGTGKEGELQASGFEVKNNALKFPAVDINEGDSNLQIEGLMYYRKSDHKWRCSVKTSSGDIQWQDCGGGGSPVTPDLISPITIWRDSSKKFKVLEIGEQ